MTRDKQLLHVGLDQVLEKRRLDQALNAKEFAVLAGISYSAACAWFRQPGFPAFCGVVFWQDFAHWRTARTGDSRTERTATAQPDQGMHRVRGDATNLPARAAMILAEAG